MQKNKLIQTPEGDILLSDQKGRPLTCPFQNGILIPGQLAGQIGLNRPPCGSQCSLFELSPSEFEGKIYLKKHCCDENEKLLPFEKLEKNGNLHL